MDGSNAADNNLSELEIQMASSAFVEGLASGLYGQCLTVNACRCMLCFRLAVECLDFQQRDTNLWQTVKGAIGRPRLLTLAICTCMTAGLGECPRSAPAVLAKERGVDTVTFQTDTPGKTGPSQVSFPISEGMSELKRAMVAGF